MTSTANEDLLLEQINAKLNAVIAGLLRLQEDSQRQDATHEALFLAQLGLHWEDIAAIQQRTLKGVAKGVLQSELKKPTAYKVYEACNGKRKQEQIAERAGIKQPSVSSTLTKWRLLRLVCESEDGKPKAVFDVRGLGINEPNEATGK